MDLTNCFLNPPAGDKVLLTFSLPSATAFIEAFLRHQLAQVAWYPALDELAAYLSHNRGRGLILMGNPGRGKTLLATKLLPLVIRQECQRIVSVYNNLALSDRERFEEMRVKWIKCLDDVGRERQVNNYGIRYDLFPYLVDDAYANGKFLAMTTNETWQGLNDRYGWRTVVGVVI